jgi:hypothetical protein
MYWHADGGRSHGADQLLSYLSRDEHELRNRRGERMSERETERFIERSEDYGHERQIILSPERGDELSTEQLSLSARKSMREFCRERPSTDYCYAVHRDTEHPHVQVAVTGEKQDLWIERDELKQRRREARQHFREPERERERERTRAQERERDREQERTRAREQGQERERDPERQPDSERERSREYSQDRGR